MQNIISKINILKNKNPRSKLILTNIPFNVHDPQRQWKVKSIQAIKIKINPN